MTRKHYIDTARLIADEVEKVGRHEPTRKMSIENIARGLANQFMRDNPRFDRQRFYFACGLGDNGRIEWKCERCGSTENVAPDHDNIMRCEPCYHKEFES